MPRARKEPGEQARCEVLLEAMDGKLNVLAEGQVALDRKIDQDREELIARMDRRFDIVEQAIRENSHMIRSLTERFDTHERAHAT